MPKKKKYLRIWGNWKDGKECGDGKNICKMGVLMNESGKQALRFWRTLFVMLMSMSFSFGPVHNDTIGERLTWEPNGGKNWLF